MAQQAGMIFEGASAVKQFTLGQNKRVLSWLDRNWKRAGLTGPEHKSRVSDALASERVLEPVVKALDLMLDEMRADPWEWCKPPTSVDNLSEYAPLTWWHAVLAPPVSLDRFGRISSVPLVGDQRIAVQERLDAWSSRLRAACDQFKADQALVQALRADMNPEYQYWIAGDSGWRLGHDGQRHRVGNPGLRGRSPEEIGLAVALFKEAMPLPMIEEARLAYDRPNARPVLDHVSEPVEPWNGREFEGVEWATDEDVVQKERRTTYTQVEHRVVYYWDGQRYQIEDLADGQFVRVRDVETGKWRDTTAKERDLMITRIIRKHETADELLARWDQWIADDWAERKAEWGGAGISAYMMKREFPDGVPESEAVAAFEATVERARSNKDAMREQEDLARARSNFKLWLRRR
jgi:hypothetical protein